MHQTNIRHPAIDGPPLAAQLREWTSAWQRGEALGERIGRELEFSTLLDILPNVGNSRVLVGTNGRGPHSLSYAQLFEFLSAGAPFQRPRRYRAGTVHFGNVGAQKTGSHPPA